MKKEINLFKNKEEEIKNMIYVVRNKQVMVDSDIALLFDTTVSLLNRQMTRNIKRFPDDF